MIEIFYYQMLLAISFLWVMARVICIMKNKNFHIKREIKLMLVYICIIVVARYTFFPFSKVNGEIQPLVLYVKNIWPFRINIFPFIYLFDYPTLREALLNIIGNITMFIPLGIVWPSVYKKLDAHKKVICAGFGFSLFIEILQLPFYDRVSDIDDLLLNTFGFLIGYVIYLLVKKANRKKVRDNER